jgi:hypothetical protein
VELTSLALPYKNPHIKKHLAVKHS